jgi:hypothetical protein
MTDAELHADLAEGLSSSQIASRRSISVQAVNKRRKRLRFQETAVAVVSQPESARLVSAQLDALEEIAHSFSRIRLLMDACDRWLRDAEDPTIYDIGPRSEEVMVTYWDSDDEGNPTRAKAKLSELLRKVDNGGVLTIGSVERYADPRGLIISTTREARAAVAQCIELAQKLADARAMQTLREKVLDEISKVSPEIAERIACAVRRVLVLHDAAGGSGALPSG